MKKSSMRWLKRIIAVPYFLALFASGLLWFNVVAPMAFLTDCSVTNSTDAPITFTPVGTIGPKGHRCPLPLYCTSFPYFMKSQFGQFSVAPGETVEFCYDMDDINFSEIVVCDSEGTTGQIVVNPAPTANQYSVPETTHVIVDDSTQLATVPASVQRVFDASESGNGLWIVYLASGTLLAFEYVRRRRASRSVPLDRSPDT